MNDFRKFLIDEDPEEMAACFAAARDKLETLFPCHAISYHDYYALFIESDSYYAENGMDTYELGLVDEEYPAMRRIRDGEVFTFRV
ncbi:MAG: hypothetical protein Q4E60_00865 [Bacteroidales bacterium]|nr:hypothetical protein [Bacteroidales bacterium]